MESFNPNKKIEPKNLKYYQKLSDNRWRKKRFEILFRDGFACQNCLETRNLQVHHTRYIDGKEPWDYPSDMLVTLCEFCHGKEYNEMSLLIHKFAERLSKRYTMNKMDLEKRSE